MSEDGFIAGENDNLDFLNEFQIEGEDYGYSNFINSVEFIVVGRRTYQKVLGMDYPYHEDKKVYVVSRSLNQSEKENWEFYNGDIKTLIKLLKNSTQKNIYCDGGAALAKLMIKDNLIDQIILSVVPLKLNKGTLLFENGSVPNSFELKNSEEFSSGLIQYKYDFRNSKMFNTSIWSKSVTLE